MSDKELQAMVAEVRKLGAVFNLKAFSSSKYIFFVKLVFLHSIMKPIVFSSDSELTTIGVIILCRVH